MGFGFPFGLPAPALGAACTWPAQLAYLNTFGDDAYGFGLECVRLARARTGSMHVRRLTDLEAQAPFDPYHYRIIFQTFYGMRDVLGRLRRQPGTAVVPFQYRKLSGAERAVVETCQASTLRRLGLPHRRYKHPQGGRLTPERLRTRRAILRGLKRYIAITEPQRRAILRDGGGDALDAVVAAVGAAWAWQIYDHHAICRHPLYRREGIVPAINK